MIQRYTAICNIDNGEVSLHPNPIGDCVKYTDIEKAIKDAYAAGNADGYNEGYGEGVIDERGSGHD